MSLCRAHRSYCGFCHVAAFSSHDWQLSVVLMAKKTTTVLPGQYDWGLGVTVVYSHWEYASFRLITNKNMNGIYCMTLFNPFIPSPPFTLANSVDPGQMLQIVDLGLHYLLILICKDRSPPDINGLTLFCLADYAILISWTSPFVI